MKDRFFFFLVWLGLDLVCHSSTLRRAPSRTRRVNLKGRRQRFDYIATAACEKQKACRAEAAGGTLIRDKAWDSE